MITPFGMKDKAKEWQTLNDFGAIISDTNHSSHILSLFVYILHLNRLQSQYLFMGIKSTSYLLISASQQPFDYK
ncbi:LacI family transcriptional regulator [Lactiplantibacillus plantarum]|nr:LacI family transcriptional regulator [Lactiplantibacillus plantarum]